jgi:hypothetical protein
MKNGAYLRTWPTSNGKKTRACVVLNGRFLQLVDASWRPLEHVKNLPGSWHYLGPLSLTESVAKVPNL